ncbi:MAG: 50S ribosomal protein L20 [Cyanobacteria bacterium]|nr:50S ribosomal protein L20 [Cyanobacteriota bacterium]MDA1020163.1 50S ribosomal protein L20 [Cyanobacteriota bacterium]
MMRVKRGIARKTKHKKILKLTKGFKGGRSKIFKAAMQGMMHALKRAFKDRRLKKRDFRGLWIQRIGAAVTPLGLSYSRFINSLTKSNIGLNRKMLAELAVQDKAAFENVVSLAKTA